MNKPFSWSRSWKLALLTCMASLAAGGLALSWLFWRYGYRRRAVALLSLVVVLSLGLAAGLWWFQWPWQRWALLVWLVNGLMAFVYAGITSHLPVPEAVPPLRSVWSPPVVVGASLGVVFGPSIGAAVVVTVAILLDPWLSTQVPINAGAMTLVIELIGALITLGLAGPILGGLWALRTDRLSTGEVARVCLSAWAVSVCFLVFQALLFGILSFQVYGMAQADILHFVKRFLLWSLFLGGVVPATFWVAESVGRAGFLKRLSFCGVMIFLLHVTWFIYLGLPGYGYLVAGRWLEQRGAISPALQLYENGLAARVNPMINSYLQHRMGLLSYKLGRRDQARLAFERTVTTYNANRWLAEEASDFLELLRKGPGTGSRVVMPGVEGPTEYKPAYCVPNSLALVLRHWGHLANPREIGEAITQFYLGSNLLDMVWYTERFPLRHRLVAFGSVDAIKESIRAQKPVLAYLPGHVVAIFGYDENLKTLVAYDTASWDIWVDLPIRRFEEEWKKSGRLLGIIEPLPKTEAIFAYQAEQAAMLHDLLAQMEYPRRPWKGQRHLEMAIRLDPSLRWLRAVALYAFYHQARYTFSQRYPIDEVLEQVQAWAPEYAYRGNFLLQQALELAVRFGRYQVVHQIEESLRAHGLLDAEFYGPIGLAALHRGEAQRAAAILDLAEPPQTLALALALEQSGAKEAALAKYSQVAKSDFGESHHRWLAMHKLLELGERLLAWSLIVEAGEMYLQHCPYDASAQLGYARALVQMAQAKPPEADKLLAKARKAVSSAASLQEPL